MTGPMPLTDIQCLPETVFGARFDRHIRGNGRGQSNIKY
jgi:hypothetical protein